MRTLFLFLGDHPALDFLNTRYAPGGDAVECIGDGRALVEWLVAAQVVDEAVAGRLKRRLGTKELDMAAEEARRLREWARDWVARWHEVPDGDYAREVSALNALLVRASSHRKVLVADGRLELAQIDRIESVDELVAALAAPIAALVTREDPSLVKWCAGAACTLSFLDRTKSHRRVFCSAAACGNRAKVAAFRERQRGG